MSQAVRSNELGAVKELSLLNPCWNSVMFSFKLWITLKFENGNNKFDQTDLFFLQPKSHAKILGEIVAERNDRKYYLTPEKTNLPSFPLILAYAASLHC